jgi:hypothetical protein
MNVHPIQLMLATLGKPPTRFADVAVEVKYDGRNWEADRELRAVATDTPLHLHQSSTAAAHARSKVPNGQSCD